MRVEQSATRAPTEDYDDPYLELPRRDGVEGIPVGGRVGEDAGVGAAIISRCDRVEFLLTRGVPQHQSYILVVDPADTRAAHNIFKFVIYLIN